MEFDSNKEFYNSALAKELPQLYFHSTYSVDKSQKIKLMLLPMLFILIQKVQRYLCGHHVFDLRSYSQ